MENSAERRLQLISRQLISPQVSAHDRNPNSSIVAGFSSSPSPSPEVIIGAMVLDVHAKPYMGRDTIAGTTIPGTVKFMSGGVARNVAECMSKLGSKPFIVSVVGTDVAGDKLLEDWKSAGLSTEGILKVQGEITPVVSNTFDCGGELAAGVASAEAVEKFVTPEFIQKFRCTIHSAPVVMVDANLHPRSLEAISKTAAEARIPVWFEPVSVAKATRIVSIAKYITFSSPNEDELIAMAKALSPGEDSHCMLKNITKIKEQSVDSSFNMLKPAIRLLLEKGIKLLVVTLGPNGVFICFRGDSNFVKHPLNNDSISSSQRQPYELVNKSQLPRWCASHSDSDVRHSRSHALHLPALPASVVSLTGAGDCLVGGILASISSGLDIVQSVARGMAVAKVAVECETNVPAGFSLRAVAAGAQQILSGARQLMLD